MKSEEDLKFTLGWLFGGNYTNESVNEFISIISLFENQAYLEKKHLMDILKWIFEKESYIENIDEWILSYIE